MNAPDPLAASPLPAKVVGFDRSMRQILAGVCAVMLVLMVAFTVYTVVMRGVFDDPPFWGDTLTLFANIWFVLLAFPLSVRERSSISMQVLYRFLPPKGARVLDLVWNLLFAFIGVLLLVYGYDLVSRIPGAYWELGNLPKRVPMMIIPITGVLLIAASALVILEDISAIRRGNAQAV